MNVLRLVHMFGIVFGHISYVYVMTSILKKVCFCLWEILGMVMQGLVRLGKSGGHGKV